MKRKVIIFGILCCLCIQLCSSVSGYGYTTPIGSRTEWVVEKDETETFIFYEQGTKIVATVTDVNGDSIETIVSTSETNTPDPVIAYNNEEYCIPFFTSSNLLDPNTNRDILESKTMEVLGTQRQITTMIIEDWLLKYDNSTGILTYWEIEDDEGRKTIVRIVSTTAWDSDVDEFEESSLWIILTVVGVIVGLGVISFYIIQRADKKEKAKITSTNESVVFKDLQEDE